MGVLVAEACDPVCDLVAPAALGLRRCHDRRARSEIARVIRGQTDDVLVLPEQPLLEVDGVALREFAGGAVRGAAHRRGGTDSVAHRRSGGRQASR